MYSHDKRHSYGTLLPNTFFFLQILGIVLLSYILVEIFSMFTLSNFLTYVMAYGGVVLGVGILHTCIKDRHRVIRRQRFC